MNKVVLIGRLTKDPEVRYSTSKDRTMAIARYTLAVERKGARKENGSQQSDFIGCVAFDHNGEFAEKFLKKGMKIAVSGRIQTGSYDKRDGSGRVYTTDVVVEEQEFAESKQSAPQNDNGNQGYKNPGNAQPDRGSKQHNGGSNQYAGRDYSSTGNQMNNRKANTTSNNNGSNYRGYNDNYMNDPDYYEDGLPFR